MRATRLTTFAPYQNPTSSQPIYATAAFSPVRRHGRRYVGPLSISSRKCIIKARQTNPLSPAAGIPFAAYLTRHDGACGGAKAPIHLNQFTAIVLGNYMKAVLQDQPTPSNPNFRPEFLDARDFATLSAACARLIPQPDREPFLGIARAIDFRLAQKDASRWSGSVHFLDAASCRLGLRGLNELSLARLQRDFAGLDPVRQDQILFSLQNGTASGGVWTKLSPRRFFEGLLHEATEIYHTAPVTEQAV
jgi:gluconate 2-dehydrogenase gamma chain